MKTSNKLLLTLLLLIFTTPLLLALTLKYKISKQDYELRKSVSPNSRNGNYQGSFSHYKVLKLISPVKGVFSCRLRPSKTPSYSYTNFTPDQDSILIYNKADTLFMEYLPRRDFNVPGKAINENSSVTSMFIAIGVDVKLPSFEKIEIKGATAIIDSLPDDLKSMEVTVSDGGELKMGENGSKVEQGPPSAMMLTRISCGVKDLTVHASGSDIFFGPYFLAEHLQLLVSGTSTLTVKDATIKKADGSLSDSISVNATWKYLRLLAPLTSK